MLPTNDLLVENVVVAESGEDSEDEWNYIKVNKNGDEESGANKSTEDIANSPTPPTASIGEPDIDLPSAEESHAVAQAIAESQEICSEVRIDNLLSIRLFSGRSASNHHPPPSHFDHSQLLNERKNIEEPELQNLEHTDREAAAVVGARDDNVIDEDDDDMDTKLNPDAKEFVPISPQRTSVHSPFSNGGGPFRHDLLFDEPLLSQSPRKGNALPMDDIELPVDNDFSEISQRPSEVVESPVSDLGQRNGLATPNGDGLERPESSNSQCSYQEMNLKEAMHGDEKQELAEDSEAPDSEPLSAAGPNIGFPTGTISESDPINMSFYGNEDDPFKPDVPDVDMNTVQPLPDDDEDNELVAFDGIPKPDVGLLVDNHFMSEGVKQQEGVRENGAQFHIEDTDFGMDQHNDGLFKRDEEVRTPVSDAQVAEEISQDFIGLQIHNAHDAHEEERGSFSPARLNFDQGFGQDHIAPFDSQPSAQAVEEPASIADVVHELATQVTSVLNEFSDDEREASPIPPPYQRDLLFGGHADVEQSAPSPHPGPAVPQENVINYEEFSAKPCDDIEIKETVAPTVEQKQLAFDPFNDPICTKRVNYDLTSEIITPPPADGLPEPVIPQHLVEPTAPVAEEPIVPIEPESDRNIGILAAAGVATATAVAAAAATVAAKTASPKAAAKPDAKKPEVKARTTASSSLSAAAKKPLGSSAAPLKSARATSATASKTATSPTKPAATKPALSAPRTARAIPATKALIEKKPASTTAPRKPLTNGTSTTTTVKKAATTSTAARPLVSTTRTAAARSTSAGTKPSTLTSTTTTRTSTLSARPASSTVPKVASTTR